MNMCNLLAIIYNRLSVWHGTDSGNPTSCSCLSAGFQRLLIFQPRITQMHMKVNKSWENVRLLQLAKEIANRIIFIDEGVIKEENSPEEFFQNPQDPRLKEFLSKVLYKRECLC